MYGESEFDYHKSGNFVHEIDDSLRLTIRPQSSIKRRLLVTVIYNIDEAGTMSFARLIASDIEGAFQKTIPLEKWTAHFAQSRFKLSAREFEALKQLSEKPITQVQDAWILFYE